jgi:hypothetical protein
LTSHLSWLRKTHYHTWSPISDHMSQTKSWITALKLERSIQKIMSSFQKWMKNEKSEIWFNKSLFIRMLVKPQQNCLARTVSEWCVLSARRSLCQQRQKGNRMLPQHGPDTKNISHPPPFWKNQIHCDESALIYPCLIDFPAEVSISFPLPRQSCWAPNSRRNTTKST